VYLADYQFFISNDACFFYLSLSNFAENHPMRVVIFWLCIGLFRNGEKINQASWLLLLSLFFTLKTVIISTQLLFSKQKLRTK